MLKPFEKDIFQRILANYHHSPQGLECRINDLCDGCTKTHSDQLFFQLCFYARLKCVCYEDANVCFFPIAKQIWKRAKSLSEFSPSGAVDIKTCSCVYFHDLVWRFVTLVSAHQDWFEDIIVMNELALPFSGWLGSQDYTYHDHFGSVDYPKPYSSTGETAIPFVSSGESYTRNAQLLSFPTSLYSYLEDHVEAMVYLEPNFEADVSIAICANAKRWLQTVLRKAIESGDDEAGQLKDLLTNIANHVRFVKLQVTY